MEDISQFYRHVEYYVKTRVDRAALCKTTEESFERFLTKASIEISRSTFPKARYGLSREDVRSIIRDVVHDIRLSGYLVVYPGKSNVFSATNGVGKAVIVFAKTKKEAGETLKAAACVSLIYGCARKTLRKVVGATPGGFVLDNGAEITVESDVFVVNMYGNGDRVDRRDAEDGAV